MRPNRAGRGLTAAGAIALLVACTGGGPDDGGGDSGDPGTFRSELNQRSVSLFFLGEEGLLRPELRDIIATADVEEQLKQTVVQLIQGPSVPVLGPVIPPEAYLRALYLRPDGTAIVDFSEEITTFHPGGVRAELATLWSIVDTLTYNFPEHVQRVVIRIGGEQRDTLAGHVDITSGYRQDLAQVDVTEPIDPAALDEAPWEAPRPTEENLADGTT